MEFVFIIKIIYNSLKSDVIIKDTFGVLFEVQLHDITQIILRSEEVRDAHEKTKLFICFEMLEEG
jgi:hypothetical protein